MKDNIVNLSTVVTDSQLMWLFRTDYDLMHPTKIRHYKKKELDNLI